jgi:hypothetical protein
MTAFIITKKSNYLTGQVKIERRLNLRFFNLIFGFMILILGTVQLVVANDLAVKGFTIRELKIEAAKLESELLDREAQVMKMQAHQELSSQVGRLNMVAVGEVEYLTVNDNNALAKK